MANRILIAALILLALAAAGVAIWANWRPDEPHAPAPVVEPAAPAPVPELAPAPAEPAAPAYPPQLGEAFVDRFDGPAISPIWFVSDGWSNGDYMENDWRASSLSLTPEGLAITLARITGEGSKPFSSGEIQTHQRIRYGYIEVRMRVPKDPGLVTGVFTYAPAGPEGQPNEIDIEFAGRDTRRIELTHHQTGKSTGKTVRLPFDAADGFHTYAIEWLPERIRWFADGVLLHEASDAGVRRLTRPQALMVQQWASVKLAPWVGELDPDGGPWTLQIACVAYSPTTPDAPLCD